MFDNYRAKDELTDVESFIKKFQISSITLPETFVDIPEEYKKPDIGNDSSDQKKKSLNTLNVYGQKPLEDVVYVKKSSGDNPVVDFVAVVFKGNYYIVLQVGINRPDAALVIVSIKKFDKNKELKQKEIDLGVIDTLELYYLKNANKLSSLYTDVIIKMLLKKYPSVSNLNPNDSFFTQDKNTMSRYEAYVFTRTEVNYLKDGVNLCIYNGALYLCIGLKDSGYNPSYQLHLYEVNGTKVRTFSFQITGFQNEQFTALTRGAGTDVGKVNTMKFYSLAEALSTSTVGSPGISTSMTFSSETIPGHLSKPIPDHSSGYSGNLDVEAWGNSGGSCRRKSKRKYKRTRTSKINKKARKTHTRRIRR